jgi:ABC-type multidrug transport system fused ATPase/permease subunit
LTSFTNRTAGSVALHGTVALVSQTAWILNATLEENVLFGKPIYDIGAPRAGDEVDCSTQLTAEDAAVYTFLGPSAKCANARLLTSAHAAPFFERMHGWLPWVVDDEKMLRALHAAGMRSVISNIPTLLMERTAGLTFCN